MSPAITVQFVFPANPREQDSNEEFVVLGMLPEMLPLKGDQIKREERLFTVVNRRWHWGHADDEHILCIFCMNV